MEPQPTPPDPPVVSAPAPGPAPRWGLGDFLLGVLLSYSLSIAVGGTWIAIAGGDGRDLAGQLAGQIGLWLGMVGIVVVASRRKGSGRVGDDFGFRARWADLGLGIAVAVVVQLVVLPGLAVLLRPLLGDPEVSGPVRDLIEQSEGPAFLGLVVSVAVAAPIVEELFFRGLLLRSLLRRMSTGRAIAVSAVAFGLAHGSQLPANAMLLVMISLTVFGAVLAGLAVRTGRLGPGIVAHAAFNLFTVVYLAVNP